jgi:hypothetical protein
MFERGTLGCYRRFTVYLIPLLLLSTLVAVSHHHDNAVADHDCPVCIAINHQTATGPLAVAFDGIPFFTETRLDVFAPAIIDTFSFFSRSTRGPPA